MINWSNLFLSALLAVYLVLLLALWPIMVVAYKWAFEIDTWRAANAATWKGWNEIRTERL